MDKGYPSSAQMHASLMSTINSLIYYLEEFREDILTSQN